MANTINSISDVTARQLCTGCGVCSYLEPARFRMGDALEFGRRPFVKAGAPEESGDALKACPGVRLEHTVERSDTELSDELFDAWGPVTEVWEGYALDDDIRRAGSSGGVATALSLYCIEQGGMAGSLNIAARSDFPYLNESVINRTRADLLASTGSRYAPASPCDGLSWIEELPGQYAFVGKPCDVAGAQNARRLRAPLRDKIGVTIAFFCAGAPSTRGTLELMKKAGLSPADVVTGLRYRGDGWPGEWTVHYTDSNGTEQLRQFSYSESWGFLQRYRQWRCYICPDHTGEFADIAVGDPWYRDVQAGEAGWSLVVARTARGRAIVEGAAAAGYIALPGRDHSLLARSQPNLLQARGTLWGRLLALKWVGAAVPCYTGFKTFRFWWHELTVGAKLSSLGGTVKRAFTRRLRRAVNIEEWAPATKGRETTGSDPS